MKQKAFYLILSLVLLCNCSSNPEQYIEHLNGYWEIVDVKKNNQLIKEYNISTAIDFFEVNEDLTGYKKKVSPTLQGTYNVTQHSIPFTLKIEQDSLNIHYNNNETTFKETIIRASEKELIITNAEGFTYSYKPYEKIELLP